MPFDTEFMPDNLRNQGDYDAFIEFSQDDVLKRLEDMKAFISGVEKFMSDNVQISENE